MIEDVNKGEEMIVSLGVAKQIRLGLELILRQIDEFEQDGGVVETVELWSEKEKAVRVTLEVAKVFNGKLRAVLAKGEGLVALGVDDVKVDLMKVLSDGLEEIEAEKKDAAEIQELDNYMTGFYKHESYKVKVMALFELMKANLGKEVPFDDLYKKMKSVDNTRGRCEGAARREAVLRMMKIFMERADRCSKNPGALYYEVKPIQTSMGGYSAYIMERKRA
jgi:hypothetical protein